MQLLIEAHLNFTVSLPPAYDRTQAKIERGAQPYDASDLLTSVGRFELLIIGRSKHQRRDAYAATHHCVEHRSKEAAR